MADVRRRRCWASSRGSSTASPTPSTTSAGPPARRGGAASCRPRPTRCPASAARSARPATTRRRGHAGAGDREGRGDRRRPHGGAGARPPRARARALGETTRRGRRSRRRSRGIAPPGAGSRGCSASACSPRWTPSRERLAVILDAAQRAGDAPVEVFALDALARIAADGATTAAADAARDGGRRMEPRRTSSPSGTASTLVDGPTNAEQARPSTMAMPSTGGAVDTSPAAGRTTRPRARAAPPGRSRSCRSGSSSARRPSAPGRRRRW